MKKLFFVLVAALCFTACHDDILSSINDLQSQYQNLDSRVTKLENLCKEMNTNISSLQTIVNVLQANDYITGITEIKKGSDIIGYTVTFGKHNPITIYNGEDGKDGKDGKDGNSLAPTIGVQKDTDGIYYWTLNGNWLLDDSGKKIRVTGEKGDKGDTGATGATGAAGQNGSNGSDGITPQLKIENDYWYISYNNGSTWTQLGKATGADGAKGEKGDKGETGATGATGATGPAGANGLDGKDGDSMFSSVTYDENYVYFTLANGTQLKIQIGESNCSEGSLSGVFSISKSDKVRFSQGNLQYNPFQNIWKFAENQYDTLNTSAINSTDSSDVWYDLLPWGSSGYRNAFPYFKANYSIGLFNYYKYWVEPSASLIWNVPNEGINLGSTSGLALDVVFENFDWGVYCRISNGGNKKRMFRTLTVAEWDYLLNVRNNALSLRTKAFVNGVYGLILLPDTSTIAIENENFLVEGMKYNFASWKTLENRGCCFLPLGDYWTMSADIHAWMYSSSSTQTYYYYCAPYLVSLYTYSTLNKVNDSYLGNQYVYVRLVRNVE